jgi:hypothetical protein
MKAIKKLTTRIMTTRVVESKENKCICCGRTEERLTGTVDRSVFRFSDEGMCLNCEILKYPERFHGCGFCKRPIREKFSCTICSDGFVEWIRRTINPTDGLSIALRYSASGLLSRNIYNTPIESNPFIMRPTDSYYKWPGFYAGLTNRFASPSASTSTNGLDQNFFPVWIIPKLTKKYETKLSTIKKDSLFFQNILLDILKTNGIHMYCDVQIDPNNFNIDQIDQVNPYDTRVVRSELNNLS